MKSLVIAFLFCFSSLLLAEENSKFAERKKIMLENMTKQMTSMQSNMTCVEAATDHEAIKKCHEMAQAERTKMHEHMIDEKIKKLEDKKKNLHEKK